MDFLVQKNIGEGIETSLRDALQKVGPTIIFRPFESKDLESELAGISKVSPNKPINLVIDLAGADLKNWDMPILSMLGTRQVAGRSLPEGSSIIILTLESKEELGCNLSSATRARLVTMDFQSTRSELGLDTISPSELAPDRLADFARKIGEVNQLKVQEMVSIISPEAELEFQKDNAVPKDYVVLKSPGSGFAAELDNELRKVGRPCLSFLVDPSDNLGEEVSIADSFRGRDKLGYALKIEQQIFGRVPITSILDVSGRGDQKE